MPEYSGRNLDGTITIEWIGGGIAHAAAPLTGPWQDIIGSTSPHTFTSTVPTRFARI